MNKDQKFSYIYKSKYWKGIGDGSLSGAGSNENTTHNIKLELQNFFNQKKIQSILDIPCGDFNWMSSLDMKNIDYKGYDIVRSVIKENNKKYKKKY